MKRSLYLGSILLFISGFLAIEGGNASLIESLIPPKLIKSARDYGQLSFAEKVELRRQAIAWVKSLDGKFFANCEGQTTEFEVSSIDPRERVMLKIKNTDRMQDTPVNTTEHYLAVAAIDPNEILLEIPVDSNTVRTMKDGLLDLLGEAVRIEDYRYYFVIHKTPLSDGGFSISTGEWLFNKKTGGAVRTDPQNKNYYESSLVQKCRAENNKYLANLKDSPALLRSLDDEQLKLFLNTKSKNPQNGFQRGLARAAQHLIRHLNEHSTTTEPTTGKDLKEQETQLKDAETETRDVASQLNAVKVEIQNLSNHQDPIPSLKVQKQHAEAEYLSASATLRQVVEKYSETSKNSEREIQNISAQLNVLGDQVDQAWESHWYNLGMGRAARLREQIETAKSNLDSHQVKIREALSAKDSWRAWAEKREQELRKAESALADGWQNVTHRETALAEKKQNLALLESKYFLSLNKKEQLQKNVEMLRTIVRAAAEKIRTDLAGGPNLLPNPAPLLVKGSDGLAYVAYIDLQDLTVTKRIKISQLEMNGDLSLNQEILNSTDLMRLPLISLGSSKENRTTFSIRQYLETFANSFTSYSSDTPSQVSITTLRDYPLMIHALKRLGYIQQETDSLQASIYRQPKWEESADKIAFSYAVDSSDLIGGGADHELSKVAWTQFYGDHVIFTNLFGDALDQYGDLFFHGLTILLNQKHLLPLHVQVESHEVELKKKLEAEYELTGRQKMIEVLRAHKVYRVSLQSFQLDGLRALLINDKRQLLKAENPELTNQQVEDGLHEEVEQEFQKEIFGANFEKIDGSWKEAYVYTQSPVQRLAWKSLISFLKHEKAMSLQQIQDHLRSAGGFLPGGFEQHPWATDFYTQLYNEN